MVADVEPKLQPADVKTCSSRHPTFGATGRPVGRVERDVRRVFNVPGYATDEEPNAMAVMVFARMSDAGRPSCRLQERLTESGTLHPVMGSTPVARC